MTPWADGGGAGLKPGATRLRETLLPKLISGDIRIKDAERIAGVA